MKTSLIILSLFLASACTKVKQANEPIHLSSSTPSSIESKALDLGSYSRSSRTDLIERLFKEAQETDPQLSDLVKQIKNLDERIAEQQKHLENYLAVNTEYFSNAAGQIETLHSDSLKAGINAKLEKAKAKYLRNHALALEKSKEVLAQTKWELHDGLIATKIGITLKMISNYQKNEQPTSNEIVEIQREVDVIFSKLIP